ncbi:MAG: sensor histidine kinase, partial [Anaerolinea sp.]|nr:sensor histidine kinase [Anaerolinea sp.]
SPVPPLPFRLAHLTWIALCAFLIWQFVLVLGNFQSILAFQHNEWSVQESLKALPGVTAASYALYLMALRLATAGFYWLTAVLIFWRKRDDWFALTVSFLLLLLPFSMVLGDISSDPLEALGTLTLFAALLLPFFFPDGRLIPQSTRWRICLIVYLLLVPLLIFTLLPLIFPHFQPDDVAWVGLILSLTAILAAGMVSQIVRYRRMAESERQQTKWVLMGGFGSLSVMFLWMSVWVMGELSDPLTVIITMHISIFASVAFPLTIGYSILRYRLWEVDVWINRTLVFGGLTVLVTAVYILTVGLMSNLFQSGSSLALSVLATGLIAILFNPVRQRLQTAVNRLMYGERDDPITVLTTLGRRLAETAVPIQTLPALVETIAQTLRLPYVAIVAAEEQGSVASLTGAGEIITAYPSPLASPPSTFAFPLVYQSETIGQLLVAPRAPGEVFNPAERRLLENVARQAGTAVYAAQLTHDLQRSRERLVTTREEERRRIRRDLHDGLGPQLATLTLKVDAARNYLRQKPETTRPHSIEATDHLLVELKREIQEAIQAVRRLAYNLRPPALDQLGLSPALSEYATQNSMNGLLVTVDVPMALPPLSAAVEVAAYRIAQEAITNVVRHARATHCRVKLSVVNDVLCLEINDDGVGLPVHIPPGVGLASMRERTAELGGTFNLQSTPGTGAQVSIRLPLTRS